MAKHRKPTMLVVEEDREGEKPLKVIRVVKERLTIHLPVELIERVKNAVFWTPGATLASLAEDALREAVDRLEKGRGEPFPSRTSAKLKTGRPFK